MTLELYKLKSMHEELYKLAEKGAFESKLPWYSTAAGGLLGTAAGGSLVPQKYKLLGQLGGALAGTGAGLEGGERIGRWLDRQKARRTPPEDQQKTAEEKKPEKKSGPGRVLGASLLGMGAGMGAGYLIPKGIDAALVAAGKQPIMPSTASGLGTFAGGALGLAAPLLHYATLQRMREEHLKNQEAKRGSQGT